MGSCSTPISPTKLRSDLYHFSYQDGSDTPLVVSVLASLIERTIARNERIASQGTWAMSKNARARVFDCRRTPDISIQSFLERIFHHTHASPSVYVVAYVYIDRFCEINPVFRITSCNVHKFLITAIMVASKFVEDRNYRNSYFASVGGLTTKEMNRLEVDFLFMMGFKLHVNVSVFEGYCCHLEREVSTGGGYQIERIIIRLMCGREIKSKQTEERDSNQSLGHPVT